MKPTDFRTIKLLKGQHIGLLGDYNAPSTWSDDKIMKDVIRIRKVFGGNMRQVGFLAAAGLYALENNIERLKDDHIRAKEIGDVLSTLSIIKKVEPVETNIVVFELNDAINENTFLEKLESNHIKIISMGSNKLRIVTHLDYTEFMHDKLLNILDSISI